jgi:YHS domain-containing protein
MAKDPVCEVEVEGNEYQTYYRGTNFCFCSTECKETFDKSPEDYVVIDDSEMPA